jgi:hypothetical protein
MENADADSNADLLPKGTIRFDGSSIGPKESEGGTGS